MIDVIHGRVAENRYLIEAKGHAGFGERGGDVICAGISAILYGFLYYLSDRYGSRLLWREEEGGLYVCFPDETPEAVEVVLSSVRLMTDTYPQYVSLTERR